MLYGKIETTLQSYYVLKASNSPSHWNQPKRTVRKLNSLMPRKAELNEPLLVQPPRHFFEDLDAARVVFD